MSRKNHGNRDRGKQHATAVGPREQVERLAAQGHLKDAFKQARIYFTKEENRENRQLLERIYFLRVQQHHRGGMFAAASEVADQMLEFGVTDPAIKQDLILLLPDIGMGGKALSLSKGLNSPELDAKLNLKAADQAVLHAPPGGAQSELQTGAAQIRAALSALDAGTVDSAMELLRDVPRSSPFADWRLFVRGLAALRRGEAEQVASNWDRLDPSRAAARIARKLRPALQPPPAASSQPGSSPADLSALETCVFGEPLLAGLRNLDQALMAGNWKEVVRLCKPLGLGLKRIDSTLAERLTRIVLGQMLNAVTQLGYSEARGIVSDVTRALPPLSFDPKWNRYWALLWEPVASEQGAEAIDYAARFWEEYLVDLEAMAGMSVDDRRRVQSLVYFRLGEIFADEADHESSGDAYSDRDDDDFDSENNLTRAEQYFEKSLQFDPKQEDAYTELFNLFRSCDRPEKCAVVARRHLEAFPDNDDALQALVTHHIQRDEPNQALPYIERLRVLKPLDQGVRNYKIHVHQSYARHAALAGKWDAGRSAFDKVEQIWPGEANRYLLLARKAAFEFKAGQLQAAEELLKQAVAAVEDPAPVWLSMCIESARYRLGKALSARFTKLWDKALAGKCRSDTAGTIAGLLTSYLAGEIQYNGRARHIADTKKYLARSSRVKFQEDDLIPVCHFLFATNAPVAQIQKMVDRGVKTFPHSPAFLLMSVELNIGNGPLGMNPARCQRWLERALEFAQGSTRKEDLDLVPGIKKKLSLLDNVHRCITSPEFMNMAFSGPPPEDLNDFLDRMEETDEFPMFGQRTLFNDEQPETEASGFPSLRGTTAKPQAKITLGQHARPV